MGVQDFQKRTKTIIIVILAFFLWFLLVQLFNADKHLAIVNVIEGEGKVGLNPLPINLDFGDLSRNTSAKRLIKLENKGRFRVFVVGFKVGEISDLIETNTNFFVMSPGTSQEIEYTIMIPPSAPIKMYKGYIWILKIPIL